MTVSEQIIQVIDALCEKFGIAINWTGENVIPYVEILCRKLITYEVCTSIAWMLILTLLSIISIMATKKLAPTFKRGLKEDLENFDCGWQVATIFSVIGLIILSVFIFRGLVTQIMDMIKCITFPEIYIFEYVSAIVNAG